MGCREEVMATSVVEPVVSPAALLRPCLEKIKQNATGRRYAKLQQDTDNLLHKLDAFLGASASGDAAPAPAVVTPQPGAEGGEEAVALGLQENADGSLAVRIAVPSSEAAPDAADDPGHMPSTPTSNPPALVVPGRPGAGGSGRLPDGAARGAWPVAWGVLHLGIE